MNIITVTQVNTYLKAVLDECTPIQNCYVVGEISNFVCYSRSGHMYFTLKDERSGIKAVMFSSYAQRLSFTPENGMSVICRGRVSVYDKEGVCQLYVQDMQPEGVGALSIAFEQLKQKLSEEGLFDEKYKKPIPRYPNKIGVATSADGAAVEDIKKITKRRWPCCELVIAPTQVQGVQAAPDIVRSLKMLDAYDGVDLIIVGRGGGSAEDLWAFNTEEVARAVFECEKPVISAVGHETDFTICDFVADKRASTPSAAAELAVPDCDEHLNIIENRKASLFASLSGRIDRKLQRFDYLENAVMSAPHKRIESSADDISRLSTRIISAAGRRTENEASRLGALCARINDLSPLTTLSRGYCIAMDGGVIRSSSELKKNDAFTLKFYDGDRRCVVTG